MKRESNPLLCKVAIPRPMWESLTYRLPPGLAEVARPGARVRVPLGRRSMIGFIDRVGGQTALPEVRPVTEVLDQQRDR